MLKPIIEKQTLVIGFEEFANDQKILQQKILSNHTAGDGTWHMEFGRWKRRDFIR